MEGDFTVQPKAAADSEAVFAASMALRRRMKAIDPDDPAIAGLTVGAWLARQDASAGVKAVFQSMVEGLWCQPMDAIPLWYLASNDSRITNKAYELQYFVDETMHALADELARELGDRLRLGTPVDRIEADGEGVSVIAGAGTFRARAVIVAAPPAMAARIGYAPAAPRVEAALDAWRPGSVMKIVLRYARPFWREAGLSGMVAWRDVHGLFACETSHDTEHAALVVFVAANLAIEWGRLAPEALRRTVLDRLAAALGPAAEQPLDIAVRDWTGDRWSGGGYSDLVMDMAARDAEDVLRAGAPPIHFACSELSPSFPGYVEGAIVIGRQVASEVAEGLLR
jgi:monoamine oxidase